MLSRVVNKQIHHESNQLMSSILCLCYVQVHWESNGQPLSRVCSECNLEFGGKSCEMGEAGEIGEASEIGEALLAEGEASEEPIMMGDSLDIG